MSRFLGVIFSFVLVSALVLGTSCINTGGCTLQKDDFQGRPVTVEVPFEASVDKGLLSWKVVLENKLEKRGYFIGTLYFSTDSERIQVDFDLTVNSKTKLIVEDKFKCQGTKLLSKEPRISGPNTCVTCTCLVNCGGKKCTGAAGNWPDRKLEIAYSVTPLVKTVVIDLKLAVPGIEIKTQTDTTSHLAMSYDPVDAVTFEYVATISNHIDNDVIVEFVILDGGTIKAEHTIGLAPFKSGERKGKIVYDKAVPHGFSLKIVRTHKLGK